MESRIRRDVWSVKRWDGAIGNYCHERMFCSLYGAEQYKKDIPHPEGIRNKIVHPAQWVVDAYLAAGNQIYP